MQFGRYLGHDVGSSGMFCADHKDTPEPYYVAWRAQALQEKWNDTDLLNTRQEQAYGTVFDSWEAENRPTLKYVRDRWPRFEYDVNDDIKVTIQWMVHDDIVLQQYVLDNREDEKKNVTFSFGEGMWIRDLEYLSSSNSFNSPRRVKNVYRTLKGPRDLAWVRVHDLRKRAKMDDENAPKKLDGGASKGDEGLVTKEDDSGTRELEPPKPFAIAVVAAVFVNGQAMQWNDTPMQWTDAPWAQTLKGKGKGKLEVVTAYKMILVPESKVDWKNFLIPAESANINKFLREEEEKVPFSEFSLSTIAITPAKDKNTVASRVWSRINPEGTPRTRKPRNSSAAHIEFFLRRHLEHILSVCAIPLREELLITSELDKDEPGEKSSSASEDVVPVAFTCGDMSMHRVCTSASL